MIITKHHMVVLIAWALISISSMAVAADDFGLIIPMPGQKQMDKASATVNVKPAKTDATNKSGKGHSEVLISLPVKIKPHKPEPKPEESKQEPNAPASDTPLIQIEPPAPVEIPSGDANFPTPPDEVTISSGAELGDMLPPGPPPEVAVASGAAEGQSMPVYPKDTSSAVFMVMKTWQCKDYDAGTLLTHAVEVYGKEADDVFKIQGLSEAEGTFQVSVEEEDITLDELLDIVAMKTGRDWGVDIPSKIIYFYPKGVKTDAYNVW